MPDSNISEIKYWSSPWLNIHSALFFGLVADYVFTHVFATFPSQTAMSEIVAISIQFMLLITVVYLVDHFHIGGVKTQIEGVFFISVFLGTQFHIIDRLRRLRTLYISTPIIPLFKLLLN